MSRRPLLLAIAAVLAAGCATPPPPPPAPEPVRIVEPRPADQLEQAYRQRAAALAAERRLADAVVQWELLTVLRPDSKEYRSQLDMAKRRAEEAAAAHVRAAEQARRSGNTDQAMTLYLRALSADPANATAAAGLQAIEVDRTRRAWLSRPPRIPYAPPGAPQPYDPNTDDAPPRR